MPLQEITMLSGSALAHVLPCAVISGSTVMGVSTLRKVMKDQTFCHYLLSFGIKAKVKEC